MEGVKLAYRKISVSARTYHQEPDLPSGKPVKTRGSAYSYLHLKLETRAY